MLVRTSRHARVMCSHDRCGIPPSPLLLDPSNSQITPLPSGKESQRQEHQNLERLSKMLLLAFTANYLAQTLLPTAKAIGF